VFKLVSGPVASLGDSVRGPFCVVEVWEHGVVLLSTGSTGFRNAAAFARHISSLARYLDKRSVHAALAAS
jgi:hypothetical protein